MSEQRVSDVRPLDARRTRDGRTERLLIEPLGADHVDGLDAALDDERVGRFIGGPDVTTRDALVDRIELLRLGAPADSGQTWLNWAVRLDDASHRVIGRLEATVHDGIAEIAYVFGPEWWGRGYATEACDWMIGTLATRVDVGDIWATVDPANEASIGLLRRLGLERASAPPRSLLSFDEGDAAFVRFERASPSPTVHLLCGLNGAGKTTMARQLADSLPAVRLSRDEWMIRLYGLAHDHPDYAARLPACTDLMWDVALGVLATGTDVVLDWNQWSRARRADAAARATDAGYDVLLHVLDIPLDTAITRAQHRFETDTPNSHRITAEGLRHFMTIYEPPGDDEDIPIERHH